MNFMTMLDIQPSATLRRQDVVAMNTNMILSNSGLMKKDLAKAMGLSPQSMASRLQSKADWTIDETCAAADFFGVPLMALLDENLTPAKAMEYIKNRRSDNGNGGQVVAGHGFEPWTSGL
nr:MAG: helix-turn-helix domain protein [Bacteriophage sp.]